MTHPRRIALCSLLLVLWLLPGCGGEADAVSAQPDGSTEVQYDQPIDADAIIATGSTAPSSSPRIAADTDPQDPSAFIVIQNSAPTAPQELIRQLQQVLPKTQVVKQVQSPNPREVKLEVTNTKDVRALANKIPFGSVESVDDRTRTIVVDFDL